MRALAFSICFILLTGCSRTITSSPLPVGPALRHAALPFATAQTLYEFSGPQGANPEANLIAVKGALYGTTYGGGAGTGVVFRITPSGAFKMLHAFGKAGDGSQPGTGPLVYVKGELYGVTTYGGNSLGTVYKITTAGKERVVYSFKGLPDGDEPYGSLVFVNGDLYGTTELGGKNDYGTVFRLSLSGKETVLYSFKGGKDGQEPVGGLTAVGHTLYGTTQSGGVNARGVFFKISLTGNEKVLHTFGGVQNSDGGTPVGGLTYVRGQLYGTAEFQGSGSFGAVFALTTSGKERVLHQFTDVPDGANPTYVTLVIVNGSLYGTTRVGGTGPGTVFKITTTGQESVVYSFPGGSGGGFPYGGLAFLHGKLYGTTYNGGNATNYGTVFSVTP